MRLFSHRRRPAHLGPFPLERLPRLAAADAAPLGPDRGGPAPRLGEDGTAGPRSAGHAYRPYLNLLNEHRDGPTAPAAPIPDDPVSNNLDLPPPRYLKGYLRSS